MTESSRLSVTPGTAAAAASLLAAVSAVRRTVRRSVRQIATAEPLPGAQGELLRLLNDQPGLTVAAAAAELRLAANTVSSLVGSLAEQGLLHRERGTADRRSVTLTVTDEARQRISHLRDLRAELTGQAMAALSPADRRALAEAVPALLRLAERLDAAGRTAPPAPPGPPPA